MAKEQESYLSKEKRALELILQENSFQFTGKKKTTSEHMEQPLVIKWQSLLPTSSWER